MEYILKIDEKGRITIPKEVREKLNIKGVVKLIVKDNEAILRSLNREEVLKEYAGIFKVDWSKINKDVKEIYKEALEERERNWLNVITHHCHYFEKAK